MINLARWLRHLPRRKPARRSPGEQAGLVGRPVPSPLSNRIYERITPIRWYDDKAMRARRDYEDKEIA